jgi:hypothetical protein
MAERVASTLAEMDVDSALIGAAALAVGAAIGADPTTKGRLARPAAMSPLRGLDPSSLDNPG